jgi:serine/threonine protein kinase
VSEEAKEFVLKLLEKDRSKRITIDDAVEHPWTNNTPDEFFSQRKSPRGEISFSFKPRT